jgi:hypothetical protein
VLIVRTHWPLPLHRCLIRNIVPGCIISLERLTNQLRMASRRNFDGPMFPAFIAAVVMA